MALFATREDSMVLVTVGVDTHLDAHVAVALDQLGRRLGTLSVPTTKAGYEGLVSWAGRSGELERVGVEGAGSYGAGLARFLRGRGVEVVEVNRPRSVGTAVAGSASPIRSTPRRPPGQFWPAPRPGGPKTATGRLR